jgi:hypothetical protein
LPIDKLKELQCNFFAGQKREETQLRSPQKIRDQEERIEEE